MEQLDIKSQDLPELKKTVEGLSEKPFREAFPGKTDL